VTGQLGRGLRKAALTLTHDWREGADFDAEARAGAGDEL
jgi:hypothetical protein